MFDTARPPLGVKSRLFASAVWILATGAAAPAAAGGPAPVDIPSGTLDAGLAMLAAQTHQQVLYPADLVAHRRARAVRGAMTPEQALAQLLVGTGIAATRTGPNVLVLQAAPTAAPTPPAPAAGRPFVDETGANAMATAAAGSGPAALAAAPTLVDEVTVTGSNIRGAPTVSPLVTVTRADLDRSGRATVVGALRALPQVFSGGAGEGASINGADPLQRNGTASTALNLRGLGANATLVLVNGRRMAGSGTFGDFADVSTIPTAAVDRVEVLLDGASAVYGPHNTILDNCHVYTAFSALDPLTQDKVSRLTGTIAEPRVSRSRPAGLAAGHASVSISQLERPLLEPGEIRALSDDEQLVFIAGQRPLRTRKIHYDAREPFRTRARLAPPSQAVDAPAPRPHPWAGRQALGEDRAASFPHFKEVSAAMDDRKAAARASEIYHRVAEEFAAQEAALDQIRERSRGQTG